MKIWNKIKERWGIKSDLSALLIIVVFAITGSSAVYVADQIPKIIDRPLNVFLRIILVFPIYQVLLILYGALFGQFYFFWEKEKKMLQFFASLPSRVMRLLK